MLSWRLTISAILIPSIIGLFWWDASLGASALVLLIFCLLVTLRSTWEMCQLLKTRQMKPQFELTAACSVLVIFATWGQTWLRLPAEGHVGLLASLGCVAAALMTSFVLLLLFEAARFRKAGSSLESLGANSITVLYAAGLLAVLCQMRWYPRPEIGYFVVASVIICVKSGDTMAYTFGRLFGKRKMVPWLSPGKTWAGGFGAMVGSGLGGWAWLTFGGKLFDAGPQVISFNSVIAYSLMLGVVGLVGDLCESLIKRDAEKKDSAQLMPGFGGLLDLLDSPLFAAPFALAWWALWPPAA